MAPTEDVRCRSAEPIGGGLDGWSSEQGSQSSRRALWHRHGEVRDVSSEKTTGRGLDSRCPGLRSAARFRISFRPCPREQFEPRSLQTPSRKTWPGPAGNLRSCRVCRWTGRNEQSRRCCLLTSPCFRIFKRRYHNTTRGSVSPQVEHDPHPAECGPASCRARTVGTDQGGKVCVTDDC